MDNPYRQLLEDHRYMLTLLRVLREEVAKYDDPQQATNVNLVMEALEYLDDYPRTFHHPLEEAAFDYLLEHSLGDTGAIEKIREQHEDLERETGELIRLFEIVSSDQVVPVSRIKETLSKYLDLQFTHIETEERDIFPAIEEHLGPEQWEGISGRIRHRRDPLFSGSPRSYPELVRRLGLEED